MDELVDAYSKCKDIDFFIIFSKISGQVLLKDHFRGHVARTADLGVALILQHPFPGRYAEIYQLCVAFPIQHQIVQFHVPVDDAPLVEVHQGRGDLRQPALDEVEVGEEVDLAEVAAGEVLHLDVEVLFGLAVVSGVVGDDVGVPAEAEDGIFVEDEGMRGGRVERDLSFPKGTFLMAVTVWCWVLVKTEPKVPLPISWWAMGGCD